VLEEYPMECRFSKPQSLKEAALNVLDFSFLCVDSNDGRKKDISFKYP
jgi:hypothetical protein